MRKSFRRAAFSWLRSLSKQSAREEQDAGIDGVPCFIFGGRLAVQGAQAPEHLAQAIERAANEYGKGEAAE